MDKMELPVSSGSLPVRVCHVCTGYDICVDSRAAQLQINANRQQLESRTLACSAWVSLGGRNRNSQMEKHLDPTLSLNKHFLGAPSVAGTVVGIKQGAVQFSGGAAGTGWGSPGKTLHAC